jgi:DNA-directed RNA polymerase subunit H
MPHILQPKHSVLKEKEVKELLETYNISLVQLPKISSTDPSLPEEAAVGDVIKIIRKDENGNNKYFRVVVL